MMKCNRKSVACLLLIALPVFFLSRCMQPESVTEADLRGPAYAGAATCITCHKDIAGSYFHTAHALTSHPATDSTIPGSFLPPNDTFTYHPNMQVILEKRDSGYYQVGYENGKQTEAHRFDVVFGSGTKAQTFLYMEHDQYYQLPVSFHIPSQSWANSPGYTTARIRFDRVIPASCFECHSSMVKQFPVKKQGVQVVETFEPGKIIYGIDCERCHGPGARHVAYHEFHPADTAAAYMTRIASLSRKQRNDLCALCHSGAKAPQRSTFTYKPGEPLSKYYYPDFSIALKPDQMDVHGTQYQLFTASACYIKSPQMDCMTCHDPHVKERNTPAAFSKKCLACHSGNDHKVCGMTAQLGNAIQNNCIDCHMPAKPSSLITLLTNGKDNPTPDYIRTHLITVYPGATKKVVEEWKAGE